ncbi:hypothetical protein [uncultured Nostoc sp.]|uniref:hypothetical protein n=2 Tax=Nostoc TaxID=1177 RepID=UPI0035CB59B1
MNSTSTLIKTWVQSLYLCMRVSNYSLFILITQCSLLKIVAMTLRELEDQALRLSAEDRWQLINTLMRSLQPKLQPTPKPKGLAASLIGIAKTDTLPPTDEEVKAMLDERLVQKYL